MTLTAVHAETLYETDEARGQVQHCDLRGSEMYVAYKPTAAIRALRSPTTSMRGEKILRRRFPLRLYLRVPRCSLKIQRRRVGIIGSLLATKLFAGAMSASIDFERSSQGMTK